MKKYFLIVMLIFSVKVTAFEGFCEGVGEGLQVLSPSYLIAAIEEMDEEVQRRERADQDSDQSPSWLAHIIGQLTFVLHPYCAWMDCAPDDEPWFD